MVICRRHTGTEEDVDEEDSCSNHGASRLYGTRGGSGGYTSGRKEIIDMLRQRSRPDLFSNTVAPAIGAASMNL